MTSSTPIPTNCHGRPRQYQVSALVEYPQLLRDPSAANHFPADARKRAQDLLDSCGGNIGAYSHSMGIPVVRKHVAEFIKGATV